MHPLYHLLITFILRLLLCLLVVTGGQELAITLLIAPMALAPLLACAGSWRGVNTLHDPHTGSPVDTPSTLTVTPLLDGRFARLDYTWRYDGKPQEGVMLVGFQKKDEVATAHWIDTWHMGEQVLACAGRAQEGGALSVLGSYAVPGHPDWGWRIEVYPDAGHSLRIVMFNLSPEGEEWPAVEASYTPAPDAAKAA